ncbi:hypothetical protein H6F78_17825 [Coleofasciculus sp. FACHB-64]|uniref:hypothetical protein n=1 Tax=Cyanophyceae TaxID=3028117 RepID=UPI0016890C72|nr:MULTISPECIES: hypothetical protein [unclassified Coleofasciculus]MBD1840966.1 hypothetical protein [Coleofasciculus sp. FACHB-501]MBD2047429.1 hypothetical protein [Coleofasciculus sp. FACHB-64]
MRSRNLALKAQIDKSALRDRISPTYKEGLEIIAVASRMMREEIEQKARRKAEIEQWLAAFLKPAQAGFVCIAANSIRHDYFDSAEIFTSNSVLIAKNLIFQPLN